MHRQFSGDDLSTTLDRCEIIQLSGERSCFSWLCNMTDFFKKKLFTGYTYDEKIHIAKRFLLPKQLKANGLDSSLLTITEPVLLHIATRYTREAGVRNLKRDIGGVVRYKAVEWAEHLDSQSEKAISSSSVNKESGLFLKRRLGKVYLCGEEILFCWRVVYGFMNRCFLLFFWFCCCSSIPCMDFLKTPLSSTDYH